MQQNPLRTKMSMTQYNFRVHRTRLVKISGAKLKKGVRFCLVTSCNCCSDNDATHRQWQKHLSKVKTLRTHRIGK